MWLDDLDEFPEDWGAWVEVCPPATSDRDLDHPGSGWLLDSKVEDGKAQALAQSIELVFELSGNLGRPFVLLDHQFHSGRQLSGQDVTDGCTCSSHRRAPAMNWRAASLGAGR
mgnify:CR=1 FL=1